MKKVAIILHAEPGTHDAMARALHSLLYAKELKAAGHEARLIFDGGGTRWIGELTKKENPMHELFESVRDSGAVYGVCGFCIGAFEGDVEEVRRAGLPVESGYMGHPSLAGLIDEGFQVITL